jgi:lipopolysaccharide assembly protein A
MRILLWLLRGIVFIALFGLAAKNSGPVDLRFYLAGVWQAPLSLVILAAFGIGAVVGLTATVVTLVRQGREIKRLRGRAADDAATVAPADASDGARR